MKRTATVGDLARDLGSEVDDVLIALWDAGFDRFDRASDTVYSRELSAVQAALGMPTASQLQSPAHWMRVTGLSPKGFTSLMSGMGFDLEDGQKTLPKGSIRRLAAYAKRAPAAPTQEQQSVAPVPSLEAVRPSSNVCHLPWETVGSPRCVSMLSVADVEEIHFALAEDFLLSRDPIFPAGVRDQNLLESAVARPTTSLGDERKYPTVEMAGAALLHSLVLNHAFHNGNKRTGLVSLLVFLDRNNFLLTCTDKELFQLVLRLADHALSDARDVTHPDDEVMTLAHWLRDNARLIDRMERPIPWRKLKTILTRYDCAMEFTTRGNCLNLTREVERPPMLFQRDRRKKVLRAQLTVTGDGMEVSRKVVSKLRDQLELDERHGVDSTAFYDDKPLQVNEWIGKYRRILELLARL